MDNQLLYIVSLIVVGALMGTVFDVYNTVTGTAKWFRWSRPVFDLTFWIASAFLVYYVALQLDNGRLRIYTFVLIVAGYLLYRMTFHTAVVASAFRIVRFTQAVLRGVGRLLELLLWRPVRTLLYALAHLLQVLYRFGCRLEAGLFFIVQGINRHIVWPWLRSIPGVERSFQYIDKVWKDFWHGASKWMQARIVKS